MTRRPVVAALVVVAGLTVLTLSVVLPRGREVQRLRDEVVSAETAVLALAVDLAELRTVADTGALVTRLEALRAQMPTTSALPELLDVVQAAAEVAGVSLKAVAPGPPMASDPPGASVIPLALTVEGSYFALARFLFELENLERLTKVLGVSIAGTGQSLTMQVAAEVYTTDTSVGPGSDPAPGEEAGS